MISLFRVFSKLVIVGMLLGVMLVSFGDLGATFSDF